MTKENKKKFLIVFGTRPEAIKLIPLIKRLEYCNFADLCICISAQHRDMLDPVLNEYSIFPDYDLDIMRENQSLDYLTSSIITETGKILDAEKPHAIIVHGDTTTAMASALAAFHRKIRIIHIEAGLRSNDIFSPFPEEFNRRTISTIATYHFAPTPNAEQNLISEGIQKDKIFTVGNTGIDALACGEYEGKISEALRNKRYIVITVHRREHSDSELEKIFGSIKSLLIERQDIWAVYPLHKSPRVRNIALRILTGLPNLILTDPLCVPEFHTLLKNCYMIMTDSGGIQEEAVFLGKPTLVLRDTTERPEGVELGVLKLTCCDEDSIYKSAIALTDDARLYERAAVKSNIYGDGRTCERICEVLSNI